MFIVEDRDLHIGTVDMLAAGAGGGEQGAGGEGVEAAHDAAGVLEEQIDGAGAEERGAGADGAGPAVEVLGALAIGERGERGAHDEALPEGVEVGLLQALAEHGLAAQEQDEGRAPIEVELAEQPQLFERGIGQPMRFIEDQQLGLGRAGELGEQGGGGLRGGAAHGGAVADGELAQRGRRARTAVRAVAVTRTAVGASWAQRVSKRIDLPVPGGATSRPGPRRVDGEAEALQGFGEARVMEQALGRDGAVEGQGGEAEVVQEFVDGRHRGRVLSGERRAAR